jgi:hypothetical protein
MEKEFILYEQALALKELGFNEPCAACYGSYVHKTSELFLNINNPVNIETLVREKTGFNRPSFYVKAPTFSQTFRWFREKYNLWNMIYPRDGWNYMIQEVDKTTSCFGESWHKENVNNFEEAELECLKKLIEIIKETKI